MRQNPSDLMYQMTSRLIWRKIKEQIQFQVFFYLNIINLSTVPHPILHFLYSPASHNPWQFIDRLSLQNYPIMVHNELMKA